MCRIITTSELQQRTDQELSVLFRKASKRLAQSEPSSSERRTNLANLKNIARTLEARRSMKFKPPGC